MAVLLKVRNAALVVVLFIYLLVYMPNAFFYFYDFSEGEGLKTLSFVGFNDTPTKNIDDLDGLLSKVEEQMRHNTPISQLNFALPYHKYLMSYSPNLSIHHCESEIKIVRDDIYSGQRKLDIVANTKCFNSDNVSVYYSQHGDFYHPDIWFINMINGHWEITKIIDGFPWGG
jgi:hypothetical protein